MLGYKFTYKCPVCGNNYSNIAYTSGNYRLTALESYGGKFELIHLFGVNGSYTFLICTQCGTVLDEKRIKEISANEGEFNQHTNLS